MRVIIAGGRDASKKDVDDAIRLARVSGFFEGKPPTEVVCGEARGADSYGKCWAQGLGIEVKSFVPDWSGHGKKAGHLRNVDMGDYADALLAVWDGESRGTKHMIDYANKVGLKVFVHYYGENS